MSVFRNLLMALTAEPVIVTYYRYNSNDNSIYITDDPAVQGNFTLQNASVIGSLTANNGVYSGFSSSSCIQLTNTLKPQGQTWKFKTVVIPNDSYGYILGEGDVDCTKPAVGIYNHKVVVFISSNGTSWDIASGVDSGNLTVADNILYYLEFGWDGTKYYVDLSTDNVNYKRYIEIASTNPINDNDEPTRLGSSYNIPFGGSIDVSRTSLTVGNSTTFYGIFTNCSTIYDDNFAPMVPQPYYTVETPAYRNFTNNGCVDIGSGKIQGASGAYVQVNGNINLSNANSWELETVYQYKGGGSEPMIWASGPQDWCGAIFLVRNGELQLFLTNRNNDWVYAAIPMGISMVNDEIYHFKLGDNETDGFYLDYYTESGQHSYTRVWNNTDGNGNPIPLTFKISSNNPCQFLNWGLNYSNYYSSGNIDFPNTKINIDGFVYVFYQNQKALIVENDIYVSNGSVQR